MKSRISQGLVNSEDSIRKGKLIFENGRILRIEVMNFLSGIILLGLLIIISFYSIFYLDVNTAASILLFIGGIVYIIAIVLIVNSWQYGNLLLKLEGKYENYPDESDILRTLNNLNWEVTNNSKNQMRFEVRNRDNYLDYDGTIILSQNNIHFNYRTLRKGWQYRSIFAFRINHIHMEKFEKELDETLGSINN